MAPKQNPLQLNALQLKTLAILQELAGTEGWSKHDEASGDTTILGIPHPHGDHFHVGRKLVMSRDATGLFNEGVWKALERKGLAKSAVFPQQITLTADGRRYETGMAQILHGGGH
ncbi:MAG TPA: hypothetical protein VJL84_03585 [Kiloniellales bacterium]|nr:hypothetical protein [Kiloniellales bacterium]